MRTFVFGGKNTFLSFEIEENRIYLKGDAYEELNENARWLVRKKSGICEIRLSGRPTTEHTGDRNIFCGEAESLEYVSHRFREEKFGKSLIIEQKNDVVRVRSYFEYYEGAETIRCHSEAENISDRTLSLEYIGSFVVYGMTSVNAYGKCKIYVPHNGWYSEAMWREYKLSDLGIYNGNDVKSFKKFCVSNTGSWSTKNYLPMGILEDKPKKKFTLWQIESNSSWSYELGDFGGSVTLNAGGANLSENGFLKNLSPGESFVGCNAALTCGKTLQSVVENVTKYRRAISVKIGDSDSLPVVFNEYMYASWCCPSERTAHELAPYAKKAGADVFVIDCGWHDEVENPFYHIGRWRESAKKYPHGLKNTMDYIKSLGLKAGLWIEPESVGVLGDAKELYGEDCFFQRGGKPLVLSNRYQLDFRSERVRAYLSDTVDRMVNELGADYLKFDYNIEAGMGTSYASDSLGEGLYEHAKAYFEWFRGLTEAYPQVIFESCASGGNRMDYLSLSVSDLVSTSDQTDYLRYPYIVSNILSAVLPEQAGIWSYPWSEAMDAKEIDEECVAMNMVNALVGRIHLASKLYQLNENLFALVQEGIRYYKENEDFKRQALPWFPKGFSKNGDKTLAFGLKGEKKALLFVYNMKGKNKVKLKLRGVRAAEVGYPKRLKTEYAFKEGLLEISFDDRPQARIFELRY